MAEATTEDVLRWEARQGPRAAVAAGLGAILAVAPPFAQTALFRDRPRTGLVDALGRAGNEGGVGSLPSSRTAFFEFYEDHAASLLLLAVAHGLGLAGIAFVLAYVGKAVHERTQSFRGYWIKLVLAGGLLAAISTLMQTVTTLAAISDFLSGAQTVDRAADVGNTWPAAAAEFIGLFGSLGLGLCWVVICLNAMRVGLLTRFMGVLGIICGATLVLPILTPIVQTFWLGAMALLLLGRWPNGVPPAWSTGEAQPWPTQQAVREARRRGAEPEPDPEPATQGSDGRAHPSSNKRKKRKKRS